jgi:AcrR family transcriptional regulator
MKKSATQNTDADSSGLSAPKADRRQEVVKAAYFLIAEKGFEGLRTREVASRVGINTATLHYYFPTKEALIQGVVEYLMAELRTSRVVIDASTPAIDRLRAEFSDIRVRLKDTPEQLVVLTELALRACRDPGIARILKYLDQGWREHLASIFNAGIAEGAFRSNLDVQATASAMMSQLRGLGYQSNLEPERLNGLINQMSLQIEHWVNANGLD